MKTPTILLALTLPVLAQQGNRKGHDDMSPVVPAELIPPAPVLSVEEALKTFTIADGFVIEPVVAEPLVEKPVALAFDEQGRMWVVEMRGYMPDLDANGEDIPQGRIAILEDTDNDGQVDKRTVFLDNMLLPRSVAIVEGGVLIGGHEALYYCKRNGVERIGEPVVVDPAYAPSGNVEHRTNALMPHLNNWLYNAKSDQRYRWKDGELLKDDTQFRGQWGITMDDFGRIYHNNNSTLLRGDRLLPETMDSFEVAKFNPDSSTQLGSNRVFPARVTPGVNRAYIAKSNGYDMDTLDPKTHKLINCTSAAGLAIYRGDNFPKNYQNIAFTTESVINLVSAKRVDFKGNKGTAKNLFSNKEFLTSTDERFRPVNIYTAPDGCLYLVDFYHGLIQHRTYMTSYLRAQYESRGLQSPSYELGRIYRIRHKDTPRGPKPNLGELTSAELARTLTHPNGWWRDTAQRLLVERNDKEIVPSLRAGLQNAPDEVTRIHALWTLQGMDEVALEDISPLLADGTSETLQSHALKVALDLPIEVRTQLKNQALALAKPKSATAPYAVRFLTSFPKNEITALPQLLRKLKKEPFVLDSAITGLLKQGISEFPNTKTKVDKHLRLYAKNANKAPNEDSLSGEHLASFIRGKELYHGRAACAGCHSAGGQGLPNLGPPLDESEWVTGDPERLTKILLHGLQGPIEVNGKTYKPLAAMPGYAANPTITDKDLADVMTFIRGEWSNKAPLVKSDFVAKLREETKDRDGRVYNAADFEKTGQ